MALHYSAWLDERVKRGFPRAFAVYGNYYGNRFNCFADSVCGLDYSYGK